MSWNFMDPGSRDKVDRAWRREAEGLLALASDPESWEAPTRAGHWEVRDVVGHLVDTTEAYFHAFDAAHGNGEPWDPIGVKDMARTADESARAFRGTPQQELVERLRSDLDKMLEIVGGLSDEEWGGLLVTHKYMGPLPACFYATFQLVDYTVHSWDIREGTGRSHGIPGDAADLLVPLCFILWQATCEPAGTQTDTLGIRVTSGPNAGDTRVTVTDEGMSVEPADLGDVPATIDFDPASFVLTVFGRTNAGTHRGEREVLDAFCNLFFSI